MWYKVGANSIGGESGGYPFIYMFHTGPDKEAEEETEKEREKVHKHKHPRAEHTKPQDEGQLKTKQKRSAKPGQPENEPTGNEPKTEIIKSHREILQRTRTILLLKVRRRLLKSIISLLTFK